MGGITANAVPGRMDEQEDDQISFQDIVRSYGERIRTLEEGYTYLVSHKTTNEKGDSHIYPLKAANFAQETVHYNGPAVDTLDAEQFDSWPQLFDDYGVADPVLMDESDAETSSVHDVSNSPTNAIIEEP